MLYTLKAIFIGSNCVGKSSLVSGHIHSNCYTATIGVDFIRKKYVLDGHALNLHLWDTAGQERFRDVTRSYYRGNFAVFLCFDTTDQKSFDELPFWLRQVQEHQPTYIILVGTKKDKEEERMVSRDLALQFAHQNQMIYFETSVLEPNRDIEYMGNDPDQKEWFVPPEGTLLTPDEWYARLVKYWWHQYRGVDEDDLPNGFRTAQSEKRALQIPIQQYGGQGCCL